MLASTGLLLTILVASLQAELICPPVSQGDLANFFPNEDDCGSYYMCDAGLNPVLMNCPDGLFWDENLDVCNWPENVECEQSGDSSSSESSSSESSSSSSSSSEEGDMDGDLLTIKDLRKH
eukprot:TRINITY_DN3872_c0_g1_i1.p1 TRINITY_DN3872_c0_g1~~TRINITY_DN3872_c0_g1_i1.p1  ORF type:complete len:121 (-),score=41.98 TRINITY_DN3872_c0_g1_i1:55-417(-)